MSAPYILCVDDDKTILISLRAQLRHHFGNAFQYEIAESAREAWEIIDELTEENETVSVIISDWLMPEVKGDEFLISVHQRFPEIIKMILTGQADQAAIDNAKKNANLVACIAKPWDKAHIYKIIEDSL